jgi:DNA repair exonuclease SbcCD ATPase subunit
MKRKKLEIDFSQSKNKILLLVGDNGTGKTSILSNLHPFAYVGNSDIRNSEDPILDGVTGIKEIHSIDGDNIYKIKHHYIYNKGSRNVKSFIKKNDVELNPNGNVSSFVELVKMELGLELDFMKLLRIGTNVMGFMSMKASDRKTFVSKLLSDVDIYSQFYKKVNEDSRLLKALLKNVSDKITRLKMINEEEVIRLIKFNEEELDKLQKQKEDLLSEMWKIDGAISALIPEGKDNFFYNLQVLSNSYKEKIELINDNIKKINKCDIIFIDDINKYITELNNNIHINENSISSNTNMINFYFSQLNFYYNQKDDKIKNLKYLSSNLELTQLTDKYKELNIEKEKLDKNYKNFTPSCSKEDLLTAINILHEIDKIITNIHEFGHDSVIETVNHFLNKNNIEGYVKHKILDIDEKMAKNNMRLTSINNTSNNLYVLFQPTDCKNEKCSYIQYYKNSCGIKNDNQHDKLKAENIKLEHRREYYTSMINIHKNIEYILMLLNTNKDLIKRLPENFFDIIVILKSIKDCIPFYNEDKIINYINILEENERYIEIKNQIKEIKKEISFIEKNSSSITLIQNELLTLDNEIYKIQKEIDDLKLNNEKLIKKNERIEKLIILSQDYKELNDQIQDLKRETEIIQEEILKKKEIEKKITFEIENHNTYENKINELARQIKITEEVINDNKMKLSSFKSLNSEKALLEEKFEDINIIKEALSSQKGIPLLFMQLYLRNTKQMVNNLLESVYNGELEIDDFEINDKEFKIPYFRDNLRVSDISQTSQGETSFVSLAFSFALASQSIDKYNIFLLDEVDSTLSQKNRYKFINILEKQLDIINAEQVFMITHNNMFDNYPVDIIMTSDVEIDNYKNMNLIFKA